MRDYTDRRVTPPKRVTSPTWGPPPPCKQALSLGVDMCTAFCNGICDRLLIISSRDTVLSTLYGYKD